MDVEGVVVLERPKRLFGLTFEQKRHHYKKMQWYMLKMQEDKDAFYEKKLNAKVTRYDGSTLIEKSVHAPMYMAPATSYLLGDKNGQTVLGEHGDEQTYATKGEKDQDETRRGEQSQSIGVEYSQAIGVEYSQAIGGKQTYASRGDYDQDETRRGEQTYASRGDYDQDEDQDATRQLDYYTTVTDDSTWYEELVSGAAYLLLPAIVYQCLGSTTRALDIVVFMGILYSFVVSYYGSAQSDSRNTWWRSDVGRVVSACIACVTYIWMFVFVSLQPLLLKSYYVVMFKYLVVVWSAIQLFHECTVTNRSSWKELALGVLAKSSKSYIEWVEVFYRAQLMVKCAWILYVGHYCYTFHPLRLDMAFVLVMSVYRLFRFDFSFRQSIYWWRAQCLRATPPITFVLFVMEPVIQMYLVCFRFDAGSRRCDYGWLMILLVFFVLLSELSAAAWIKKEAIVRAICNKGSVEYSGSWLRCLPEVYGLYANMVLSIASFLVYGDWRVFVWPVTVFLIDWLKNDWLEKRLQKQHADNFAKYTAVCVHRYMNECV